MYKKNRYINRLKRLSNKKLIEIATILGLVKMSESAKTFVDRRKNYIIVYRQDDDYSSLLNNKTHFSAIFLKEFTAKDDFGKDLSRKYHKILSELYPKFYDDYNEVILNQTKAKLKQKTNEKSKNVQQDEENFCNQ